MVVERLGKQGEVGERFEAVYLGVVVLYIE